MKQKDSKIAAEDIDLFRQAIENARPITQDKIEPYTHRPPPNAAKTLEDEDQVLEELLSESIHPEDLETGEELLYRASGIQGSVFRKLRRGHYAITAELDLHGYKVHEAQLELNAFIRMATRRGLSCVRIIHGKGRGSPGKIPIIKGMVNKWLRQKEEVLAFCTARAVDGGSGAVYVLLKHRR
jgi:DNA-nicking Smr family endonuclease